MNKDSLVKLLGWQATVLHGDPLVLVRWLWLRRHLWPGPCRTLDAGCGSGAFTMYAAKIGNEAVGISFNRREVAAASRRAHMLGLCNARFIEGDLRTLALASSTLGRFDQVICCETIEHILDDRKLLTDMIGLLSPGGQLLLTTPCTCAYPLPGDRISSVEDGGHARRGYTQAEIRTLCQSCGINVEKEEYLGGIVTYVLAYAERVLSRINARVAWLLIFPIRALQILDTPLTRLFGFPFMSIGIVGRLRSQTAQGIGDWRGRRR